jgi:metal-responsive CopG/Arc/MetJ family transcriptional regulator
MKKMKNRDRRVKFNMTIPPRLLTQLDDHAAQERRNRSNFVCELIHEGLEARKGG